MLYARMRKYMLSRCLSMAIGQATKGPWSKLVKFPRHAVAGTNKFIPFPQDAACIEFGMGHVRAVIRGRLRLVLAGGDWMRNVWDIAPISSDCIWPKGYRRGYALVVAYMEMMNDYNSQAEQTTVNPIPNKSEVTYFTTSFLWSNK